jgi:hypothetical protein
MQVLRDIVNSIRHTPSADNTQPWQVKLQENTLTIQHDTLQSVTNPLYNIDYFADYVSLGMLLENLAIALRHHGISYEIKVVREHSPWQATVTCQAKTSENDQTQEYFKLIPQRYTDRRKYHSEPLDRNIRAKLEQLASCSGARLFWKEGRVLIKRYAPILALGDSLVWQNSYMRNNLIRMLRFGKNTPQDGLPLKSLGISWEKRLFLAYMIRIAPKFPSLWNLLGYTAQGHTKELIRNTGALCALSIPHLPRNSSEAYQEGGKVFQRIWLELTKEHISLQPIFLVPALLLNQEKNLGGLTKKQQQISRRITSFFQSEFPSLSQETLVAFFRIGYPRYSPLEPAPKRSIHHAGVNPGANTEIFL